MEQKLQCGPARLLDLTDKRLKDEPGVTGEADFRIIRHGTGLSFGAEVHRCATRSRRLISRRREEGQPASGAALTIRAIAVMLVAGFERWA